MLPPPLKRMSTMMPFLFQNWLISFWNRCERRLVHRADVHVARSRPLDLLVDELAAASRPTPRT